MSKANRPRPSKPKQPLPPPPPPDPAKKGPLRQLWGRWWGKALALYAAFATFATVVAGVDFFHQTYLATIPDIQPPVETDEASPLSAPFRVQNRSSIFAITNVLLGCYVDFVDLKNGAVPLRNDFIVSDRFDQIDPGETVNMRCAIGNVGENQSNATGFSKGSPPIVSAHLKLATEYKILGYLWHSPFVEFTWFATPHRHFWVQGRIATIPGPSNAPHH